jgi:DNA helicase-2/ATP-dependent DNA helicase PcrA
MPGDDIDLLDLPTGSVSAPAGCGKTQLICDAVRRHDGRKPILILTHTNAGVAALRGRLQRARVPAGKYRIATIDGWAMRLISMFPLRSGHDPEILQLGTPNRDYPAIRDASVALAVAGHLDDVIAATYDRLIVDEYQDCLTIQHRLVRRLSKVLPAVVLGDPMQAIFGFGNNVLVDWARDVRGVFPEIGELTTPHRWKNAGHEGLGRWLLEVRATLLAGHGVDLTRAHTDVRWEHLNGRDDHERRLRVGRSKSPVADGKVLVIVPSFDRAGQIRRQFASQLPGAVVAEAVDMTDLVAFGESFQLNARTALKELAQFAQSVMTNFSADDLIQRLSTIRADRHRNEPNSAEIAALAFVHGPSYTKAANLLEQISALAGVRVHRPAILSGAYTLLRSCDGGSTPYEAALAVRERSRLIGRPLARRTVGSTLLLKGLEAELAIILHADEMDARHLYVAATRGSHGLVVCSSSPVLPR